MKLSVLIPVYNEKQYIKSLINKVKESPVDKEIIIVDDHSDDGTAQFLQSMEKQNHIRVVFHEKNMGKSEAVKSAMKKASGEYIIIQDADNEYDPDDYRQLLAASEGNKNIAVYGNRFSKGFVNGMTIKQKAGNLIMTALFNILMGQNLRDMETCYKLFPRESIDPSHLQSTGFGIDPEITARLLKSGLSIKEIPISYYPRPYEAGKKIKLKDAFITFLTIIKYSIWL